MLSGDNYLKWDQLFTSKLWFKVWAVLLYNSFFWSSAACLACPLGPFQPVSSVFGCGCVFGFPRQGCIRCHCQLLPAVTRSPAPSKKYDRNKLPNMLRGTQCGTKNKHFVWELWCTSQEPGTASLHSTSDEVPQYFLFIWTMVLCSVYFSFILLQGVTFTM